jgi:hypothetical protein
MSKRGGHASSTAGASPSLAEVAHRPQCRESSEVASLKSIAQRAVLILPLVATLGSLPVLALVSQSNSGDQSLTDALARGASPPLGAMKAMQWVGLAGIVAGTYLLGRAFLTRHRSGRRRGWAVLLLAAWVALGAMQDVISVTTGAFGPLEADAGYVVLPAALGAAWWLAATELRETWAGVWSRPGWRWRAAAMTALFTLFYLWTSKQVQVPSPHDTPPHGAPSFVVTSSYYGPLAMWPSVEFWVAPLKLGGAISLGSGLVTVTLATLTALVLALYVTNAWQASRRRLPGQAGLMATLSTAAFSGCCCCSPTIFPVLAALFGTTGAGSVSAWLSGTSSPFSDVVQAAAIGFLLGMLTWQRRRLPGARAPELVPSAGRRGRQAGCAPSMEKGGL